MNGAVVAGHVVIQQAAVQAQILLAGVQSIVDDFSLSSFDGDAGR